MWYTFATRHSNYIIVNSPKIICMNCIIRGKQRGKLPFTRPSRTISVMLRNGVSGLRFLLRLCSISSAGSPKLAFWIRIIHEIWFIRYEIETHLIDDSKMSLIKLWKRIRLKMRELMLRFKFSRREKEIWVINNNKRTIILFLKIYYFILTNFILTIERIEWRIINIFERKFETKN